MTECGNAALLSTEQTVANMIYSWSVMSGDGWSKEKRPAKQRSRSRLIPKISASSPSHLPCRLELNYHSPLGSSSSLSSLSSSQRLRMLTIAANTLEGCLSLGLLRLWPRFWPPMVSTCLLMAVHLSLTTCGGCLITNLAAG